MSLEALAKFAFALFIAAVLTLSWKSLSQLGAESNEVVSNTAPMFQPGGAEKIRLKWSPSLTDASVQISSDRKFISLEASGVVSGDSFELAQDIPDGRYYWRLVNAGNRIAAGPFTFEVRHKRLPKRTTASAPETKNN